MLAGALSLALLRTVDKKKRKVLLIGWDAADWEHITPMPEEGLMPTLDSFIDRGVMGNLATPDALEFRGDR